jgi:acyl-CoA reductase-like NAD-dependent aldehyde dehydrogenase
MARLLEARIPEFAKLESLQTGRTIREMSIQLGRLPEWLYVPNFFPSILSSFLKYSDSDYFAALIRTQQSFVAPTQGKLLNYVQRVPLGVVAQITVRFPTVIWIPGRTF